MNTRQIRERSRTGKLSLLYTTQLSNSKKRGHVPPSYSREEFITWAMSQKDFERIYTEWVKSGYKSKLAPSGDRLDSTKPYSLDNLRLVTWGTNEWQAREDERAGVDTRKSKAISQYTVDGKFVKTHYSIASAVRELGASGDKSIMNALTHTENVRAYKHLWCYVGEEYMINEAITKIANNPKGVKQYTKDGILLREYWDVAEAARETGILHQSIAHVLKGRTNSTSDGSVWVHKDRPFLIPKEDKKVSKVDKYSLDGTYLGTYNTMKEAATSNEMKSSSKISEVCRGRRKSAGGFIWKYKDT